MSAAYAMSLDPEKFEVTVFDKEEEAGGMATSVGLPGLIVVKSAADLLLDPDRCVEIWCCVHQRWCSRL